MFILATPTDQSAHSWRRVAMRHKVSWLAAAGSCVALATASVALAAEAESNPSELQEIVVTATKRTTTLQETPISIAAVTGDDIVQRGIPDVNALVTQVPGVSLQTLGPGRTNYNIRGMSDTGGSSPTVGFYLDDVPVTPATSAISAASKSEISPDLYDLERVEVLRGPQGTLYGSGSEGGTIRLLTNQPKLNQFEATTDTALSVTEHSGGPNYNVNGMVNLPLATDYAALRVVVTEKFDDGYLNRIVENPFPPYSANFSQRGDLVGGPVVAKYSDVNYARTEGIRAQLLIQPNENLKITPSVFFQKIYQGGQNSFDLPPGTFAHYEAGDVPERFQEDFVVYALTIKYDAEAFSISSTTSQLNTLLYNLEDVDEQWYGFFLPYGSPFLSDGDGWERHDQRQTSEELRVSSRGNGPLEWLVGAYYNHFTDDLKYYEASDQLIPYDGSSVVFQDYEPDHLKQEAGFGEATYAVVPKFKITAGLRYFHYQYDFLQEYSGLATAPPLVSNGTTSASGSTPKVALSYLPSENLTLFASATKGFRPGSSNLPIPPAFCNTDLQTLGVATYQPDSVWSYEVGEKARLFNGTVGVRASAYYIDWKDIQQNVPLACGYSYTANAGEAVSKGGELEFDAKLTSALTIHGSAGYTDASITSSSVGSALTVGSPLADVPKWTGDASIVYNTTLPNGWGFGARADDAYVGWEYDPNAQPYYLNTRGGYNLVNVRVGVMAHALAAYLYGDNILNKVAYLGFDRSEAQNTPQYARVIPNVPRTIGVDLQYRF